MRFSKGDVVEIEFDDHVEQDNDLARVVAYGRVAQSNARKVVIETWHPRKGPGDREQNDLHTYTISRGSIVRAYKLRRI